MTAREQIIGALLRECRSTTGANAELWSTGKCKPVCAWANSSDPRWDRGDNIK